jgi:multicomponent K+:H+ antiporter subunit E
MMKRLLPAPILSLGLLFLWLLLSQSLSPGTLLLGAILAVVLPIFAKSLRPTPVRVRRPLVALRLLGQVLGDMLRSNRAVVMALLRKRDREMQSGFIEVPLELRDPNALAVLAMIVSATPGTAWGEIAFDRSRLLVHVLEMGDPEAFVGHIKMHYERPLMEIFE